MNIDNKKYREYADRTAKKSPLFTNCLMAFATGGLICCIAEAFYDLYVFLGISIDTSKILVPCTLIFISAFLTGIGKFDNIAKHAGAGTLVPITGFANAVVSPALDTKAEGFVLGVGAKIFTVSGPVILYGVFASVIYGIFYCIFG